MTTKQLFFWNTSRVQSNEIESGVCEVSDPAALGLFMWGNLPAASIDPLLEEVARILDINYEQIHRAFSDEVYNLANKGKETEG